MKLYCINIIVPTPTRSLISEYDLSSFGYFQRGSVQEFMAFFCKTFAERTTAGTRQTVKEQNYVGHAYTTVSGLTGVILADAEYPSRVAFSVLNKVCDEFLEKYPKASWSNTSFPFPLKDYLTKYQDPKEADPLMRIQKDLDETKIILHQTIDSMLERGQKLDVLMEKSDELSSQTKTFYKTAKKTNSCCSIQ